MKTMNCDKCGKDVSPNDNTVVYDAALAALTGYQPQTITIKTIICGDTANTFRSGEVVDGDARTSIQNVLSQHFIGRHFHASHECEGSPSRRMSVEKGVWGGSNKTMDDDTASAAKLAYRFMQGTSAE